MIQSSDGLAFEGSEEGPFQTEIEWCLRGRTKEKRLVEQDACPPVHRGTPMPGTISRTKEVLEYLLNGGTFVRRKI